MKLHSIVIQIQQTLLLVFTLLLKGSFKLNFCQYTSMPQIMSPGPRHEYCVNDITGPILIWINDCKSSGNCFTFSRWFYSVHGNIKATAVVFLSWWEVYKADVLRTRCLSSICIWANVFVMFTISVFTELCDGRGLWFYRGK